MTNLDLAIMGLSNLFRRKARTILTVLGVVIGTASIVVMVSLGLGMDRAFAKELEQYGSLTMITINAPYDNMGAGSGGAGGQKLLLNDTARNNFLQIPHVKTAIGMKRIDAEVKAGRYRGWGEVMAIDLDLLPELGIKLSEGRLPTKDNPFEVLYGYRAGTSFYDPNSRGRRSEVEVDLFKERVELMPQGVDPSKRPKGVVIHPVGMTMETDYDYGYKILIDYDSYMKFKTEFDRRYQIKPPSIKEQRNQNKYDEMKVIVDDIDNVLAVQEEIKAMGFDAFSLTEALGAMRNTSLIIQLVLGGIGAVSMFVAAIGITNTMVMSIYERTKEIGVMKVIGAQLSDIRRLFLFEAAMIGLIGGAIGLGLSFGISGLLNSVFASGAGGDGGGMGFSLQSYIPFWLAAAGVGFSVGVGLISGFYPAVRATKLSALEAIRSDG